MFFPFATGTGDWKISIKPDEKPPKSLFDQSWEVLGKLVKVVAPVVIAAAVYFFGFWSAGGELNLEEIQQSVLPPLLEESNFALEESMSSVPSPNAITSNTKRKKRGHAVFVSAYSSEQEKKVILDDLKNLRLIPEVDFLNNTVFINNIWSGSRAQSIVQMLNENGYPQARLSQ
ncbi:MAG: hypothetical protein H6696_03170 [Deferribacteres bacterium]|nr:hypothetical protein [candidate division KSB1 bacterium]MCB9500917.1 hypothetical protein [Deferribacteres bacterium]